MTVTYTVDWGVVKKPLRGLEVGYSVCGECGKKMEVSLGNMIDGVALALASYASTETDHDPPCEIYPRLLLSMVGDALDALSMLGAPDPDDTNDTDFSDAEFVREEFLRAVSILATEDV